MSDSTIEELIRRLMRESEIVYLATNGLDGCPQIRAVFNLRNEEQFPALSFLNEEASDMTVTISTNTSSKKVKEIINDPRVSVYYCKPGEINGVQLSGEAEIVSDMDFKRKLWVDGWERYYPLGVEDPDYTILRMRPKLARGWATPRKFEAVLE